MSFISVRSLSRWNLSSTVQCGVQKEDCECDNPLVELLSTKDKAEINCDIWLPWLHVQVNMRLENNL
jgi:hypothetical protein